MIVVDPGVMPFTTPVPEPIDAVVGVLLVHVPPEGVAARDTDPPVHTCKVPLITGTGLTVTAVPEWQPVVNE